MDSVEGQEVAEVGRVGDSDSVSGPVVRELTPSQASVGWKSFRLGAEHGEVSIEVFISPSGHWYKWTEPGEKPDLLVPSKTLKRLKGLTCIDHWRPTTDDTGNDS